MSRDDAPGYRVATCCFDCMHTIERKDGWFCTIYNFLTQRHMICDMYEIQGECHLCGKKIKDYPIKSDDGQEVCEDCDYTMRLEE